MRNQKLYEINTTDKLIQVFIVGTLSISITVLFLSSIVSESLPDQTNTTIGANLTTSEIITLEDLNNPNFLLELLAQRPIGFLFDAVAIYNIALYWAIGSWYIERHRILIQGNITWFGKKKKRKPKPSQRRSSKS